ncbi:uncharacterized protein LOC143889704 [Tasmannia lanceolata]|uniref:uncharacterized protein LOC143889704 n=1 Tax=Tasmannia lanceolata TaxID=3420 RepID=UPI004063A312
MDFIPDLAWKIASSDTISGIVIGAVPLWIAAFVGLLIGWSWRPRWAAALVLLAAKNQSRIVWTVPPGLGVRRVWLAFLTALSAFSLFYRIIRSWKSSSKSLDRSTPPDPPSPPTARSSTSSDDEDERPGVTEADLNTLISYIDETDGGPPWQLMMNLSTTELAYQAWRRDPEFGPTEYRTRTVIENVAPELMRDFYWDDEFRTTWDDRLVYFRTLEESPRTGTMIVRWIRKFPFFCNDREYIIIRRIWESGSTYYCITKDTPYPALPRHRKPRRVDLYYSSWRIKAVESRNGGSLTASEVLLFHHEEMGIPKEIAKIGIQRGMWGLVEKMRSGVQAYQMARSSGGPPSRYAIMAHITTKIPSSRLPLPEIEANDVEERVEEIEANDVEERVEETETHQKSKQGSNPVKWLIVGGVLIVCGLNGGAIGKGIVFGIVRGIEGVLNKKNRDVCSSRSPEARSQKPEARAVKSSRK